MRYTVSHEGVPVGTVELAPGETVAGELAATPAYKSIQAVVRAASEVLWSQGFLATGQPAARIPDAAALARAQSLPLELRDSSGGFVAADFVNIVERPGLGEPPVAFVRFRHAPAADPAVRPPREGDGRDRTRPDA